MRFRLLSVLALIVVPSLLPAASHAGALHIEAKKMLLLHQSNRVEFTGSVVLQRDDFELRCNKLIAHYRSGRQQLEKAEAFGNVRMRQGKARGKANKALLDQAQGRLTLIGHAYLEQDGSRIEGETIAHNMNKKETLVTPAAGGRTRMLLESDEAPGDSPAAGNKP